MPSSHKLVFTNEELRIIAEIDPLAPCREGPGSKVKVLCMAKRYQAGADLFQPHHDADHSACEMFERIHGMAPHSEREDHIFHVFDDEAACED